MFYIYLQLLYKYGAYSHVVVGFDLLVACSVSEHQLHVNHIGNVNANILNLQLKRTRGQSAETDLQYVLVYKKTMQLEVYASYLMQQNKLRPFLFIFI